MTEGVNTPTEQRKTSPGHFPFISTYRRWRYEVRR
jgi:hypothetical protein